MLVADVIVDRDIWGLDRPLTYLVPEKLHHRARLGSIVRVPLRGKRVRGWIVEIGESNEIRDLEPLAMVSGPAPVFDEALLEVARRLATRYVHPLSSFLSLFTPQRMGRAVEQEGSKSERGPGFSCRIMRLGTFSDPVPFYIEIIDQSLKEGSGSIVCVPEVLEGSSVLEALERRFPSESAVLHSGIDPAKRSASAWKVATGKRSVVLGGRSAIFCPPMNLSQIVIHEENDLSYKEQRAPYQSSVEAAIERARACRTSLTLSSRTPSLATISRARSEGWPIEAPNRAEEREGWPIVELLDPSNAVMPRRAIAAIIEARRRNERTIVLLPRTASTASGPGVSRLAEYIGRVVPGARITRADRPSLGEPGQLKEALSGEVIIATEAALAEVEKPKVDTAIALGIDSSLKKPLGRAVEDLFQTLWELGCLVAGRNPKGRLLLEIQAHDHYVAQALTRGDYQYFADRELEVRKKEGSPPFVTMIRLQIAGQPRESTIEKLNELPGATVMGPVEGRLGSEMMLKVLDLDTVVEPLRAIVAAASERILVEVDPREW